MAVLAKIDSQTEASAPVALPMPALPNGRRYIDSRAGHALEILGHAIEYLADESAHEGGSICASDGEVQAIQLLMKVNRQIYYQCPLVPTFAERCLAFMRFHRT